MKLYPSRIIRVATLLALGLPAGLKAQTAVAPRDSLLDDGWKFIKQDTAGAEAPEFSDAAWEHVPIPHTWNNLDGEDGGSDYFRGACWYRKHLKLDPAAYDEKSIFLKFEGASLVTDVYVNGQKAGSHSGAFGAFCFDITKSLKPGTDNVIAVKVNNAKDPNVAPLSGDFTVFGGIYRDIHLLALNKLSISPLDDASPGVYLRQHDVSRKSASVDIETILRNDGAAPATAVLRYVVTNGSGVVILTATSQQAVAASGTASAVCPVRLLKPHLWNGRGDPYLYKVRVDVMQDGVVADSLSQPLGLRFASVNPDKGFFLNGEHYALYGVCRHQDRKDKGWAISSADHDEDFGLIMEMGCTGIRLAHYQHADYFYGLCDNGGLVVWAELPLVNELGGADFNANAQQQLNELIKQNFNHPSIIFWSLSNELHKGKDWVNPPDDTSLINRLNDQAHKLDPSRITVLAACISAKHDLNLVTDAMAFNRYPGWYYDKPEDYGKMLDKFRAELPGRAIGMSEYGAGANILHHQADLKQPKPGGPWHPEEWQAHIHEAGWQAMEQRPWLWCEFLWNMFDFGVDMRSEGSLPGLNDKGLVTYDRKTRKDAFYWYKANWSTEPFVHINSSRFTPRPLGPTQVRVYSNLKAVELFVNGASQGVKSSASHIFEWDAVPLADGGNAVNAIAKGPRGAVTDSCAWQAGKDAAADLLLTDPALNLAR